MTLTIQSLTSKTGNPLWILQTRRTAYVFGIDTAGYLQHVYWGSKLVTEADYEYPEAHHERRPMERSPAISREEFPVWGDYAYGEPCLKAQFADGVRTTLLQYVDSAIESDDGLERLVIHLKDPYYPLHVRLIYRPIPEHDLIERSVRVENAGDQPIMLERIMTAA